MKHRYVSTIAVSLLTIILAGGSRGQATHPAEVKPEMVGFSTERLERLHVALQKTVEDKELPGIVTVLARHGKVVEFRTYGKKDIASGTPSSKDDIFRIYSMTKPITGVAMMILYEQGKWSPGDPIAKYIPEFAKLQVLKGMENGQPVLEAPAHPPTMAELMSHNAGFTYGIFGNTAVDKMYQQANVFGAPNLQGMIDRLAKIPLLYQPGTKWVYSISVDIQGYIVEKLSGKTLGEFMRENIFDPVGMKDTGFHVPAERKSRLSTLYAMNPGGQLAPSPAGAADVTREPGMPSGGGGLFSTTHDYLRFCQMVLNGGELDGKRILAPSSVALMRTNRLPPSVTNTGEYGIGFFHINRGFGFGLDFAVYTDPLFIGHTVGKGTYTWGGAAGTWFWIDPANDIVFVGMTQRMIDPRSPDMDTISHQAVYQALLNAEK